jgi:Rrf2 family protein
MINISKKTEYALRAILYMMNGSLSQLYTLQEISQQEKIPAKYLEQIFTVLKKNEWIQAKRGINGGYSLVKNGEEMTMADLYLLFEDHSPRFSCVNTKMAGLLCECGKMSPCSIGIYFDQLQQSQLAKMQKTLIKELYQKNMDHNNLYFDI